MISEIVNKQLDNDKKILASEAHFDFTEVGFKHAYFWSNMPFEKADFDLGPPVFSKKICLPLYFQSCPNSMFGQF